jgi:hypothetical protein
MLNINENDITIRLDKLLYYYNTTVNLLENNKFDVAFSNLNNIRLLNSDIITISSDYSNLNKLREFKDNNLYLDRSNDKIITKDIKKKIKLYENNIFKILQSNQNVNIKSDINKSTLARFYIERYMPLAWNKKRDLVFLANISDLILLKELIKVEQKNIIVLNQNCDEVNNFIRNNKSNSNLVLVNCFKEIEIRKYFVAASKLFFSNCNYTIWSDFPNKLNKNFTKEEAKNTKNLLANYTYEDNSFHRLSDEWIKNGLQNLKSINNLPNIADLKNIYLNKSVIIVCAGPSLDKDITYLKKLNGKIFICATGHTLKALKKHNIIPDIVLHIDPFETEWSEYTFANYDFSKINLLLLAATCNNKLFKKPAKNIAWLLVNNAYDDWLSDLFGIKNSLENSLTVGQASLIILSILGFKNISFIGLDHSFEKNEYAESIGNSKTADWSKGEHIKWPSKNKGLVTTSKMFISSILAFERLIPNLKKKYLYLKFYNCSSMGANIKGLTNTTLKKFSDIVDFEKIHTLTYSKNFLINNNIKTIRNISSVNNYFDRLINDLDILYKKTNLLLNIFKKTNFSNNDIANLQNIISSIINYINNNKVFELLVQKYLQDYNQRRTMILNEDTDIQLQRKLYDNLNSLFLQAKSFIRSLKT